MGARYYNPALGRFMAMDPVGFQEGNIHSHNRYTYANNNPYKFVDPDGREAEGIVGEKEGTTNQQLSNTAKAFTDIAKSYVETRSTQIGIISTSLGLGGLFTGLKGLSTASTTVTSREAAKDALYATKSAGEISSGFGWGKGLQGAKDARGALAADPKGVMTNIQSQATRAEAEAAKSLYSAAAKEGKGLPVSTERGAYMSEVLNLWK